MGTTTKTYYTAQLKNNCPVCFANDGMVVSFKQKWKENRLLRKATNDLNYAIACEHCTSTIYPVQWTDDIERVFEFHQKMAKPERFRKLKPLAFMIIGLCIVGIAIGVFMSRGSF